MLTRNKERCEKARNSCGEVKKTEGKKTKKDAETSGGRERENKMEKEQEERQREMMQKETAQ